MSPQLRELLERGRAVLAGPARALRTNRGWLEATVLVVCALAALGSWGHASHERATALRAQALELEGRTVRVRQILSAFTPADSVERDWWRASELALAGLASSTPDPLGVSRQIALRAEESGVASITMRLVGADTASAFPTSQVGSWVLSPGERGLGLDFTGRWDQVIGLIGSLPPQVDIASLQLSADGGLIRARLVLVTRHLQRPG
jgi:hypothetical protein